METPLLPNVEHWGHAYTHVVMDKSPGDVDRLDRAFVANVQKIDVNARMSCQLFVPSEEEAKYQAIQQYELDVLPLKEEDAPHMNFCIWVDPETKIATYLPISSRVQLSTGRPLKKKNYNMKVSRRAINEDDRAEMDERVAEVDADVEERVKSNTGSKTVSQSNRMQLDSDSDDDDSEHGESFVKTIVAEG
jgi:RNA polymerase II-associated factor 1